MRGNQSSSFICPHCLKTSYAHTTGLGRDEDSDGVWEVLRIRCPACNKLIFYLVNGTPGLAAPGRGSPVINEIKELRMIHPKGSTRAPCPSQVPQELADDYTEACLVLPDSPKASAALSRRCLQTLLRDHAKVKPSNLFDEIQELLNRDFLPSHLAAAIDAIRNIGNFAAHPIKSEQTGKIIPVEPGEAEWNLDVLEMLFDFYFVAPDQAQKKRDELNRKLQEAGKPPMK